MILKCILVADSTGHGWAHCKWVWARSSLPVHIFDRVLMRMLQATPVYWPVRPYNMPNRFAARSLDPSLLICLVIRSAGVRAGQYSVEAYRDSQVGCPQPPRMSQSPFTALLRVRHLQFLSRRLLCEVRCHVIRVVVIPWWQSMRLSFLVRMAPRPTWIMCGISRNALRARIALLELTAPFNAGYYCGGGWLQPPRGSDGYHVKNYAGDISGHQCECDERHPPGHYYSEGSLPPSAGCRCNSWRDCLACGNGYDLLLLTSEGLGRGLVQK